MDNQVKLDGIAAVCAVGGAIAAAVTNSVAAAAFPLAGAVMLQIVNRQQLMKEMEKHGQNVTEEIDLIKQQFNLFAQEMQLNQTNLSTQIQQQKQDYLTNFEIQIEKTEQLQQLLDGLKHNIQNIQNQQQNLSHVVDQPKQIENISQTLLNSQQTYEMYYQSGLSHQRLGDENRAIADLTNAIRLNPHCAKAYHMRGLIKANLGDRRSAVFDLRDAAKYYFDDGDLANYNETRSLSQKFCDGISETEIETPTITQETFDPITASHLFDVN